MASSCGSKASLGNNKSECPVCQEEMGGRYLFNHLIKKHQTKILEDQTKDEINTMIETNQPFLAYNDDGIILQGCLGCCVGYANGHKASKHFKDKPECLKEHIKQMNHLKLLVKKTGPYTEDEVKEYLNKNKTYKFQSQKDKNECTYMLLASSMEGLDKWLCTQFENDPSMHTQWFNERRIKTISFLKALHDDLLVKPKDDEAWIEHRYNIQTSFPDILPSSYSFDFDTTQLYKFTPFTNNIDTFYKKTSELYLTTNRKTFTYNPIELQCEKVLQHISTEEYQKEYQHTEFLKVLKQDQQMLNELNRLYNQSNLQHKKHIRECETKMDMNAHVVECDEENEDSE